MANLLVVDDEADIRRVMVKILEARGHDVATANDGLEALEAVATSPPDLVILDVNLPHIDGFEVCKRLKTDPATSHIPVIMVTAAYVSVHDAQHGTGLGADEYVTKPFLREVLVHNVERLVEQKDHGDSQ